jgi:hypothetical protein
VAGVIAEEGSDSEKKAGGAGGDIWGHSGAGQTFILRIRGHLGPKSRGERGLREGKSIEKAWSILSINYFLKVIFSRLFIL